MFDDLTDHGSNSYNLFNEANDLEANHYTQPGYGAMSLKELNLQIDSELLEATLSDILSIPPALRSAAIADFEEIDPALGAKLRLELLFTID
jgi:hypothetical protein